MSVKSAEKITEERENKIDRERELTLDKSKQKEKKKDREEKDGISNVFEDDFCFCHFSPVLFLCFQTAIYQFCFKKYSYRKEEFFSGRESEEIFTHIIIKSND